VDSATAVEFKMCLKKKTSVDYRNSPEFEIAEMNIFHFCYQEATNNSKPNAGEYNAV
jgi:hypothetical protein